MLTPDKMKINAESVQVNMNQAIFYKYSPDFLKKKKKKKYMSEVNLFYDRSQYDVLEASLSGQDKTEVQGIWAPGSYALSGSCQWAPESYMFLQGVLGYLNKGSGSLPTLVWRQGKGCCFLLIALVCCHIEVAAQQPLHHLGGEARAIRWCTYGASAGHRILPCLGHTAPNRRP